MGSELKATQPFSYGGYTFQTDEILWPPALDNKLRAVKCIEALHNFGIAEPVNTNNYENNYGTYEVYKSLINRLKSAYGTDYDVKFLAYDWRDSNRMAAIGLNNFIENQNYDKVILVCHSMGGLVGSNYLSFSNECRNKVKKFITLGTPFLGAPALVDTYVNKKIPTLNSFFNWLANHIAEPMEKTLPYFQGVYELFPTEQYFSKANQYYITRYTSYTGSTYDSYNMDYAGSVSTLNTELYDFSMSLYNQAESVNASLYVNGQHVTSLISGRCYFIVGTNVSTPKSFDYYYTFAPGMHMGVNDFRKTPNMTTQGDGTVPLWSANLANSNPSRTYTFSGVGHQELVESNDVFSRIQSIIG